MAIFMRQLRILGNMRAFLLAGILVIGAATNAQQIEILSSGNKTSVRGLSAVNDRVVWVSGSHGMVGRSNDSGHSWKWMQPKGYETRDFRDIEAFDAVTAIIMAVDTPAIILRTVDGGEHWTRVYENKTPGMFLDAMEFWNQQSGIVLGDPIDGKFFIARTFDEGRTWHETSFDKRPAADSGEACFASSGTNVRRLNLGEACFISGGKRARFFSKGAPVELPLLQGQNSQGANSIAIRDDKKRKNSLYYVVVGGDFMHDSVANGNCAISSDGGHTWKLPVVPPHGYRSCVEFIDRNKLITCGTSGVDVSADGGVHWTLISKESFHVCRRAKEGRTVFLAGNGRIARLTDK
jgi:photosystem II stability/assembly factor-like uncharacterized protein